jgi:hypothetical protein
MDIAGNFPEAKAGRGLKLTKPPTGAEVRKTWLYTSPYVFMT